MRIRRRRALIALSAGLAAAACSSPPRMEAYAPARIGRAAPIGSPRPIKVISVRIYADADHRAQVADWKHEIAEAFKRANQVLMPSFAVKLEIEEARAWDRTEPASSLEALLHQLEETDPGEGVHLVLGLVSSLPSSSSVHQLGLAQVLGRHLVLRGMHDADERRALLALAQSEERDPEKPNEGLEVYAERVRHRETVVLLHELGHTLGAIHTNDQRAFMSSSWSGREMTFDEPNATIIALTLRNFSIARTGRDEALMRAAKDLVAHLKANPSNDWVIQDADLVFNDLRKRIAAVAEVDRLNAVVDLGNAGKFDGAWSVIEPKLAAQRDDPLINRLACWIGARHAPSSPVAIGACDRAAAMLPDDPRPLFDRAVAALAAKDHARAASALREGRARLERGKNLEDKPKLFARVAALAAQLDLVTVAEDAVPAADEIPEMKKLSGELVLLRRRHGLPRSGRDFQIAPDDEPQYLAEIRAIQELVNEGKVRDAKERALAALARWPNAPGFLTAECAARARLRDFAAAEKACARATAIDPETSFAQLLTAMLADRTGRRAAAIASAERAVALDAGHREAWEFLAELYRAARDTKRLEALRASYREQFDKPLAP